MRIIISSAILSLLVGLGIILLWGWWPIFTLGVVYISIFLTFILIEKKDTKKILEEKLENRIWTIEHKLLCPSCSAIKTINFSLESTHFNCTNCNKKSKLILHITPVLSENSGKDL